MKISELITEGIETPDENINTKLDYTSPKLTKFGKINNITKGTGSVNLDEGSLTPDRD